MKGYVSIYIPVKKYTKAYLHSIMGKDIIMDYGSNNISNKLYDLLEHSNNERKCDYNENTYSDKVKVFIPLRTFNKKGCNLNETNVRSFNKFVELEVKSHFYFMMDFYISILPSFEANIDLVRSKIGIDEEDWSTETLQREYRRYRKRRGLPTLYKKNK